MHGPSYIKKCTKHLTTPEMSHPKDVHNREVSLYYDSVVVQACIRYIIIVPGNQNHKELCTI